MKIIKFVENRRQERERFEESFNKSLVDFFQPLVDAFCKKYDAIFFSVNGQWCFHFGDIYNAPDEDYFRELDPDLLDGLSYEYDTRWDVGCLLDCYPRVK